MGAPINPFKELLQSGRKTIGMWMGLGDPFLAEVTARAGFDWVLIDGEHAPNDFVTLARQLQVAEPHVPCAIRLPMTEPWLIKQALDAGMQTLLAPMVNTAEEAREIVRAMRYPPEGIRGVGYALGRASHFGAAEGYATTANDQMCLIVQIETRSGLDNLEEILAVEGVDAAFVGPADLAADLGFLKDMSGPEMKAIIAETLARITAAGKPAGIIDFTDEAIEAHFDSGAQFVAVGADVLVLSNALRELSKKWKGRIG